MVTKPGGRGGGGIEVMDSNKKEPDNMEGRMNTLKDQYINVCLKVSQ